MAYLILLFGVFCCSTSVLFIKIGSTDPVVLSAYRLLGSGILLAPLAIWAWKKAGRPKMRPLLRRGVVPGIFLAFHLVTWIVGARLTSSANATLLVNMVPVLMPLLLFLSVGERINKFEGTGTLLSMAGVAVLAIGDFHLAPEYALGDTICFLSMIFYSFYLLYGRKNKDLPSIYIYVVPVYLMAGALCLTLAGARQLAGMEVVWFGHAFHTEWVSIIGLTVVNTVVGHSIINWALRSIRGQAVVIINLGQFVFAGILGYIFLSEIPNLSFYQGAVLSIAGALVVIIGSGKAAAKAAS